MFEGIAGRRRGFRKWKRFASVGLRAGCLVGLMAACQPSYDHLLEGVDGEIRLEDVFRITGDEDLTEDEQRQALRDLGITDEELIDVLVRGF